MTINFDFKDTKSINFVVDKQRYIPPKKSLRIRSCQSKMDRHTNGQKKNNDLQNIKKKKLSNTNPTKNLVTNEKKDWFVIRTNKTYLWLFVKKILCNI